MESSVSGAIEDESGVASSPARATQPTVERSLGCSTRGSGAYFATQYTQAHRAIDASKDQADRTMLSAPVTRTEMNGRIHQLPEVRTQVQLLAETSGGIAACTRAR